MIVWLIVGAAAAWGVLEAIMGVPNTKPGKVRIVRKSGRDVY